MIATLGRADKLLASGKIDGLLRSPAKFTDKLRVEEATRPPALQGHRSLQQGLGSSSDDSGRSRASRRYSTKC